MAQLDPQEVHDANKPPAYFCEALTDAERLLKYAAEIGLDVNVETRAAILHARTCYPTEWTEDVGAKLLEALTKLAALVKPVTSASLKAYNTDTRPTVHTYLLWAIALACVIIPVSVATFVTSAVTVALRGDITRANALAVKLRAELGPPPPAGQASPSAFPAGVSEVDVISDLQEYAATVRLINSRAQKLNRYILPHEKTPLEDVGTPEQRKKKFELPVGIEDPLRARDVVTDTYQDVRYFAQNLMTDVAVFYGAISTCILPVLYALLGTCAYLLRTFEHQMSRRIFVPSAANSARFLIAAIGGSVIGLFNNFSVTEQASIPPLALAFLTGYAVDVFFAFLEGILVAFTKSTPGTHEPVEVAKA